MRKIQIEPRHFRRDNTFLIAFEDTNNYYVHKKLVFGDQVLQEVDAMIAKGRPSKTIYVYFTDFTHVNEVFKGCLEETTGGSSVYFLQRYKTRCPHLYMSKLSYEDLVELTTTQKEL
jgi:hypothetical protein